MSVITYSRKKKTAIPSTISLLSTATFLTKSKDAANKENLDISLASKKSARSTTKKNTALQPKKSVVKKPVSPDEKPKKKKQGEERGLNKFLAEKSKVFAQVDEFQLAEADQMEDKKKPIEVDELSMFKALRSVSDSVRSNATIDSNMLDLDIEPMPAQIYTSSPAHSIVEDDLPAPDQFFRSAPLASSTEGVSPPTSTPARARTVEQPKIASAKAATSAKAVKTSKTGRAKKAPAAKAKKADDADLADFLFHEFVQPQESSDIMEDADVFATPIKSSVPEYINQVVQETPTATMLRETCSDEYRPVLNDYLSYRQIIKQSGLQPISIEEFASVF